LSVPSARGFLLLRRGGGVWGIASSAVDGLARQGTDYRVAIADSDGSTGDCLVADEILGVVEDLRVWPLAPVVRRFWPERAAGLAVHGEQPVVVVDPAWPPAVLRVEREEAEGDRPE
jgi:hypothetical protein